MNKKFIFGIALIILFTTFISQKKNSTNKFKIQEIKIENNFILSEKELLKNLSFLYEKEIFFLKTKDIEKKLKQNSFIKGLKIKKIYPNKIIVYIIEKDPIAIVEINNHKFFLGKKFDLIKFYEIPQFKKLPTVYGDNESFKILLTDLKKMSFPIELIEKYFLFETKRWDLQLKDKKLIKLPPNNYKQSLKNFLGIKDNKNFSKYKVFDYRLNNQLILK